ncbi:methylated-DNA--[protein]-cysteine S-methyltransferase [Sutcliffiella rhizosphaerae]|uniref:Methylated-DNA--protein-cysteine methyltransferase n=1 Tax=Sutcliffiella rhizosphaerae TaxID=2880967 RepID=A0ABM8YMY9_9BACI|nr:methylated-DNA--[protein]-cysteine S-methyltransferase [Sutcliffiella rhizosphaerae]CAG9621283.1 Methylated-DNA--protein-cysteine methyltransferase, constitutive [Sutcliffiella rhizosphaerae]
MTKLHKLTYSTPIGMLEICGTAEAIHSIMFIDDKEVIVQNDTPPLLQECLKQLDEYFNGERKHFTFPCHLEGTNFQKSVWEALKEVPYSDTVSYKNIATSIGNEKAIRAVGSANGKNKLTIVIPCHRVIGSNGTLTGYAGGLWRKEWLLQFERSKILS